MTITTVHNELIAVNAISGTAIADNAVTSVHIAKNNIGTVQIAQNSVTSVSIAENNVTGTQIAMNAVTSTQLADNAVTATKIPDGTQLALGATNFSGSVGIGTASPEYELEVKASTDASINIRAGTNSGDFAGLYFGDTDYPAEGRITYQNSDNKMRFWSDRQHVMTLDDNVRVGIGTESPSQKLEIYNSATDGQAYVKIQNNRSRNAAVNFVTTAANWYVGAGIGTDTDVFQIYDGDVGTRLQIDSSGHISTTGNLGVGMTPTHQLSVIGTGTATAINMGNDGGTLPATLGMFVSSTAHTETAYGDLNIKARTDYGGYYGIGFFTASSNNTPALRMKINSSGFVQMYGELGVGDKISHGNGVLDLYDGGSNTTLTNGVTNGNIKMNAVISGVGTDTVARFGDGALGQMDTPYQSGFMAHSPAVTNGGGNRIVFGGTHHTMGADYSTSTGKYTAPRTGRYIVSASVLIDPGSTSSYERILFGINEAAASTTFGDTLLIPGNTSYHALNISGVFYIDAGDTISVYNMGQSPTYGTSYGAFSAFYLG